MPVYTYRCDNCGVQFERQGHFNERNLTRCPECGKKALHRVYRPVGVVFKGSGFYITDNRSSSSNLTSKPVKADTESKPEKSDSDSKTKESTAKD